MIFSVGLWPEILLHDPARAAICGCMVHNAVKPHSCGFLQCFALNMHVVCCRHLGSKIVNNMAAAAVSDHVVQSVHESRR